jgi:hypothetical protein
LQGGEGGSAATRVGGWRWRRKRERESIGVGGWRRRLEGEKENKTIKKD